MKSIDSTNFIGRLRKARKRSRISQAEMAQILGISRRSYGLYELGHRQMSTGQLAQTANVLNTTADWLLFAKGEQNGACTPPSVTNRQLPLLGLAECGLGDWYKNEGPLAVSLPCPPDITDPNAFCVMAVGTSLLPEGVKPGFVCICAPTVGYRPGDIVFLQEKQGPASMKVYVDQEKDWVTLKGWMPPNESGHQESYTDKRPFSNIEKMATVIYIKRKL